MSSGELFPAVVEIVEPATVEIRPDRHVPIEQRAKLCSCGAIVKEADAEAHCLGHAGDS